MRIAQLAPLYESVPPRYYGGTERVVSYLTEALVAAGHDVTLFAAGDSITSARLVASWPASLRLSGARDTLLPHVLQMEQLLAERDRFDVVHFHTDYLQMPFMRRWRVPHLTTLHGRLDLPELVPLFATYPETPLVSISDAQRAPLPHLNWLATVHHGLPRDLLQPTYAPGSYLAFVGRISPEKGVDRAIEIARRCQLPLRIAAKVSEADVAYYDSEIRPLLDDPLVDFVGEIAEADKGAFFGGAAALLTPIDWPEPFGLVMIEALACGVPVIAFRRGSAPEIVEEGVSGFLVDDVNGAVRAVGQLDHISRHRCRERFERRFSADRMARHYVALYRELAADVRHTPRQSLVAARPTAYPEGDVASGDAVTLTRE